MNSALNQFIGGFNVGADGRLQIITAGTPITASMGYSKCLESLRCGLQVLISNLRHLYQWNSDRGRQFLLHRSDYVWQRPLRHVWRRWRKRQGVYRQFANRD